MTKFDEVLQELKEMHDRKQADYGRTTDPFANVRASEDFGIPGYIGALAGSAAEYLQRSSTVKNAVRNCSCKPSTRWKPEPRSWPRPTRSAQRCPTSTSPSPSSYGEMPHRS